MDAADQGYHGTEKTSFHKLWNENSQGANDETSHAAKSYEGQRLGSSQVVEDEFPHREHHVEVITETARYPHNKDDTTNGQDVDESASDASSSVCDRRLSRAARSLLVRPLRSILSSAKKFFHEDDYRDMSNKFESASVWQLLEHSLAPHAYAADTKCPLLPTLDVLRHDEENSVVVFPPPKNTLGRLGLSVRSALYQIPKREWLQQPLYQCGFCGKLFSSRFYLDSHLDNHHPRSLQKENSNPQSETMICPANSWCQGLPPCSQHALEIEPYYGRGSNGLSPHDRNRVRRQVEAEAEDFAHCDEAAMQRTKRQCFQMMQDCFAASSLVVQDDKKNSRQSYIHQRLTQSLCEPISCPDRLHQLFFAATAQSNQASSMMMQNIHEWHDEWDSYYAQHHTMSRFGVALLMGILLCYSKYLWKTINSNGSYKWLRQKDPKGTRLLQRRSGTSILKTARKKVLGSSTSIRDNKTKKQ